MHLKPFQYSAPTDLPEALALLSANADNLTPLAGGTDLLVMMKEGRRSDRSLVSLRNIDQLRGIDYGNGTCRIGATTTVAEIGDSPLAANNPAFGDAVRTMATPQIRNRATLGGNLCTSAACADFPPVLLINDAVLQLTSTAGEREVAVVDFFTGLRQVDRRPDELLTGITCSASSPGSAYIKFGVRKAAIISITGVACSLTLDGDVVTDLRVATTAACPMPGLVDDARQLSVGKPATDETWSAVADAVTGHQSPISDLRGSSEYRLHLARVGTVRALKLAADRFREAVSA